jgi:hypothetical protein
MLELQHTYMSLYLTQTSIFGKIIKRLTHNLYMFEKLEDPIYSQRGGIISLMGKAIIKNIISVAG